MGVHPRKCRLSSTRQDRYGTQVRSDPPTFVLFVNDTELVTNAYQRYLENALRKQFGFRGTGVRMIFRNRSSREE